MLILSKVFCLFVFCFPASIDMIFILQFANVMYHFGKKKNNRRGGIMLLDFRSNYKTTVIKIVRHLHKNRYINE